jgi:general secretion pathway protein N
VTPDRRRLRTHTATLGIICAMLATLIVLELRAPDWTPAVHLISLSRNGAGGPDAAADNFKMKPFSDLGVVQARPLFSPTRRPAAQSASAQSRPSAAASFTLVGILISPGGRYALLESGQPARLSRVMEGQQIEGWTVASILSDRVLLRSATGESEVRAGKGPGN